MNKSESKYFNTAVKFDKALLSLLEKKPFEYITVSELCVEAGVNRSTFISTMKTPLTFCGRLPSMFWTVSLPISPQIPREWLRK